MLHADATHILLDIALDISRRILYCRCDIREKEILCLPSPAIAITFITAAALMGASGVCTALELIKS